MCAYVLMRIFLIYAHLAISIQRLFYAIFKKMRSLWLLPQTTNLVLISSKVVKFSYWVGSCHAEYVHYKY